MSSPQWVYLILTVVMGIPTVVYGGLMAVAGLVLALISMGEGIPGHWGGTVFLMSWAGAGVLGLLSWLWISWRYLRQGATGLRRVGTIAWSGLAAGIAARGTWAGSFTTLTALMLAAVLLPCIDAGRRLRREHADAG